MTIERNAPIAVFDSGVGGISVLHQAINKMPDESFVYYADVANVPYGNKSKEEVTQLTINAIQQIVLSRPKAIVIACNTATSVAINELRAKYHMPIIGMEPAVRPAIENTSKKVIVLATDLTIALEKYNNLLIRIQALDRVTSIPMPKLITAAEEFTFQSPQLREYVSQQLKHIKWEEYSAIVLGCTHFIYFKPLLREIIPPQITITDGNAGTINHLMSLITPSNDQTPSIRCILSGREVDAELLTPYLKYLDNIEKHYC